MFWLVLLALLLIFQFVVLFFGAPYVPTLKKQRQAAFELLSLKPGQTLLDLGCGDGVMLKAAAKRGLNAIGYEINPLLALIAWLRTRRYRSQVRIVCGSFWRRANLAGVDGVFVFLTDPYMKKLDNFIKNRRGKEPLKLASYGFPVPDRKPTAQKEAIFLYKYK